MTTAARSVGAGGPLDSERSLPTGPRFLALLLGAVLGGTYLGVFYHVVDVVGGVSWFLLSVGLALLAATALARWSPGRVGVLVGALLVVGGLLAYLLSVPDIFAEVLTVEFARRWLSYLTGLTVLQFRRADVWAIVVAPGPAFLSWFLLLTRRYAASALVGGLVLAFFASTGDAGATTTVVGMTSLLGLLGVGQIERNPGAIREVVSLGVVLALGTLLARSVRLVPASGGTATAAGSGGSGGSEAPALAGDLEAADEEANIHESISLSPRVLFTVEVEETAPWRAAAYDRYRGSDWVRTGDVVAYDGPRTTPPGESTRLVQSVEVRESLGAIPAAWKPVSVEGLDGGVRVTDLEGFSPTSRLEPSERYEVTSAVPDVDAERLREAGVEYPEPIRERYLQLPESTSDHVVRLAEQVAGDEPTAHDAAVAIGRWLGIEKSYDTSVSRPSGDVAEAFLFSMDRGYCVYFATAMAVLLRALGVPARFVLGYTAGQPVGEGRFVVRGFDSHAWVEVYFPGRGWVSYDPTPSTPRRDERIDVLEDARRAERPGVDAAGSVSVSTRRLGTDVEDVAFNRSAVDDVTGGTDVGADANATPLRSEVAPPETTAAGGSGPAAGTDTVGQVGEWLAGRDRIALLAGAASAGLGLYWTGVLERGYDEVRLRWQGPTDSPRRDVERAYRRFEILLARRYRERTREETRRRYLAAAGFRDVAPARRLVDLYEQAVYGEGVSREEADEAIRIVDDLVDGSD